jgi:hypothetical protein
MSQKLNAAIAVIGIDIGKNSLHVVGHAARGAIVLRQMTALPVWYAKPAGDSTSAPSEVLSVACCRICRKSHVCKAERPNSPRRDC